MELRRGLEPVSMDDVPLRLKQPRGRKFIAFTFDDGYRDNFTHALPIFREAGVPFTVNVTTGFIAAWQPVWWYGIEQIVTARERWRSGGETASTPSTYAPQASRTTLWSRSAHACVPWEPRNETHGFKSFGTLRQSDPVP